MGGTSAADMPPHVITNICGLYLVFNTFTHPGSESCEHFGSANAFELAIMPHCMVVCLHVYDKSGNEYRQAAKHVAFAAGFIRTRARNGIASVDCLLVNIVELCKAWCFQLWLCQCIEKNRTVRQTVGAPLLGHEEKGHMHRCARRVR